MITTGTATSRPTRHKQGTDDVGGQAGEEEQEQYAEVLRHQVTLALMASTAPGSCRPRRRA